MLEGVECFWIQKQNIEGPKKTPNWKEKARDLPKVIVYISRSHKKWLNLTLAPNKSSQVKKWGRIKSKKIEQHFQN